MWSDLLGSDVGPSDIQVGGNVVLDLHEDDRASDEDRGAQEHPIADELRHEGDFLGVDGPHDGRAGGLDSLVETDVVGGSAAGVGEGAHEPVYFC